MTVCVYYTTISARNKSLISVKATKTIVFSSYAWPEQGFSHTSSALEASRHEDSNIFV